VVLFGDLVALIGPMRVTNWLGIWWGLEMQFVLVVACLVAGTALIQTHRKFAARREETQLTPFYALVPLAVVTIVATFGTQALTEMAFLGYRQESQIVREVHSAIVAVQPNPPLPSNAVQEIKFEELAKTRQLSSGARKWLRNSVIAVVNDTPEQDRINGVRVAPATFGTFIPRAMASPRQGYLAVVRMPGGRVCSLKYKNASGWASRYSAGYVNGTCE
jgi:hypothetical protein